MIKADLSFQQSFVEEFKRNSIQKIERAVLVATDRAAADALRDIRQTRALGRLANAIGKFSDLEKGSVFRTGTDAFSASGGLAIKTRNERTVGAIKSYTEGAEILPKRGRFMWFPTPELQVKRVQRQKITPALYNKSDLPQRLGPLVQIPGRHSGEALLIIRNVQTKVSGRGRPIRGSRSGIPRAGREQKEFIVAFVGIKRTTRQSRIDIPAIMRANAARVMDYFNQEMRSGA